MKNTVRVRKNRSAFQNLEQAKTPVPDLPTPEQAFDSLTEMELATHQSNTLLELLTTAMDSQIQNGHWTEKHAIKMSGGIAELATATSTRLEQAYDGVWKNCRPARKEVAS